jgi:hypothetical protein
MAKSIPDVARTHYDNDVSMGSDEIRLEIDGLIAQHDGSFILRGTKPVDLDYRHFETIQKQLNDQGVPQHLAYRLCEEAMQTIMVGILADALAQRTRRIG